MLERLLPAAVAVAEARGDIADALLPEEKPFVADAVEKRRREFTTGRACARSALAQLDLPPCPILSGPHGAPQWPAGIVGSITHCEGYRACAVARTEELASIGIDAELDAPLPDGLLGDIALAGEREHLQALAREEPGVSWDRLLFSAKESVYKAWFPLAERWLGFEDACLAIDRGGRTFSARLLVPGPTLDGAELTGFAGSWSVQEGIVLTAIAVPTSRRS
jgi:4'-phosphopantetheinyl transferase EntD